MLGLTACRIDLLRGVVHRDGALATLTTREAELMRFLAEHPSRVVSRDELLAQVWGYTDAVVSRACDNTVRRLREKVESDAGHPDHILTVHGAGYRFEPTATGAESSPAAAPPPSRVVDLGPVRIDLTRRRVMDTSGAIHALNEAETAILALLDDAQGESVDRDALGAAVWGRAKARPRVASTVRGLRTKLEPEPSAPRFLVSTRGGYRLVVPQVVERVELVGRDELVAQVLAALGADRWVLLLGPAGVGKSSLARRAAASVAGAVVWVDLATASTPSEAAARVARALDVDVGGADPVARVAQALSDRGAPFVVLDNLEGLADGAAMIEPWLAAGPVVRLLGTSRRRVGAAAEVVIEVGPLDREPAIDLFVRRARAVSSTNRAIGEHRDAIGALVERLERMPLAIELAAARTAVLGVDDLVERLRIDLLSRPTGGDPRHRSLRTAILASLGMLGPARLGALHDLALFRSGFDLEDAVGVLGDDAVDLLQSLRDDSLVHADPQGRTLRFDVWQAVRELLDEVAPDPGRLTRHCRQLAQLGRDGFDALGRDGSRAAIDRLRARVDDCARATDLALGLGEDELAACCASAAAWVYEHGGPYVPALALLDRVLARPLPPVLRARLLLQRGNLHRFAGSDPDAELSWTEAVAVATEHGAEGVALAALAPLGHLYRRRGRYAELRSLSARAAENADRTAPSSGIAELHRAQIAALDRDERLHRELLERGVARARASGRSLTAAQGLLQLCDSALTRGDLAVVRAGCEEAHARFRALGIRTGEAQALIVSCDCALHARDLATAERWTPVLRETTDRLGSPLLVAIAHQLTARTHLLSGDPTAAAAAARRAEAAFDPAPPLLTAQTDEIWTDIGLWSGDLEGAVAAGTRSRDGYTRIGGHTQASGMGAKVAAAWWLAGDEAQARAVFADTGCEFHQMPVREVVDALLHGGSLAPIRAAHGRLGYTTDAELVAGLLGPRVEARRATLARPLTR